VYYLINVLCFLENCFFIYRLSTYIWLLTVLPPDPPPDALLVPMEPAGGFGLPNPPVTSAHPTSKPRLRHCWSRMFALRTHWFNTEIHVRTFRQLRLYYLLPVSRLSAGKPGIVIAFGCICPYNCACFASNRSRENINWPVAFSRLGTLVYIGSNKLYLFRPIRCLSAVKTADIFKSEELQCIMLITRCSMSTVICLFNRD